MVNGIMVNGSVVNGGVDTRVNVYRGVVMGVIWWCDGSAVVT